MGAAFFLPQVLLSGSAADRWVAHTVRSFMVAWKRQSCPIAARRLIEADNVENLLADKYFWDGLCQEMCRKAVKELQEDVLKIFSLGSCPR